ncbi:TlpA family protein disulfide reductase [Arenimonas oryziterrae]|uniref:Thioredoxin domain-containing protein n=1 Tax=Arenimonas oryziterrae DSM 21050 = YC6267 TaxID=1121015 RepID=A0A091BG28_9GAMM|nr:TlpA disulfide reductase family protein [Arenimonas oryziterrae]KFN43330.1 hypothetical protein N789_08635 [Arenimonas oryziterrae DSM 21050 = YC6267]
MIIASGALRRLAALGLLTLAACAPAGDQPAAPAAPAAPVAQTPATPAVAPTPPPAAKPEMPTLVVDTFTHGKFDLATQRGHWVVVNFWATWCTPCLKEIPDLDAFDLERDDVSVIGLAYEEIERADMEAFLEEHVIHYPIAVLDVYNPPADFDTPRGLPMTYLIAPDGKVAKKFLGPITSQEITRAMDEYGKVLPAST